MTPLRTTTAPTNGFGSTEPRPRTASSRARCIHFRSSAIVRPSSTMSTRFRSPSEALMAGKYDAIIIGAGHNGLVTACYLGRAGWRVLVLERRPLVGGACVTEEVFPGFKVSTAAYVNSLFRKEIIRDLKLHAYGFEILERSPASFTPFPDGRYLIFGSEAEAKRPE